MKKPKRFIIPIFIPHEGCRFRCVFCDQRAVTGQARDVVTTEQIRRLVDDYVRTSPGWEGDRELAFYGGSFTALDTDRQRSLLAAGKELIEAGTIQSLRVSTRPDAIDEEALERLARFGVCTVEIGVQSMDDNVLLQARRGHGAADSVRAAALLRKRGFSWIAQVMPGLPGDSESTMLLTAREVARLSPDGVRIYPAVVLEGTPMELFYRDGRYRPLSLTSAVRIVSLMLDIFEASSVPVIRIGLNHSVHLQTRVVAGPYHESLGSLVHEARLLDRVISEVNRSAGASTLVVVQVHPRYVSRAIGNERSSLVRLRERFPERDFKIVGDPSVEPGKVVAYGV